MSSRLEHTWRPLRKGFTRSARLLHARKPSRVMPSLAREPIAANLISMPVTVPTLVDELASSLLLGALLARVSDCWGGYELLEHWQQGEFHNDVVLRIGAPHAGLPGPILV